MPSVRARPPESRIALVRRARRMGRILGDLYPDAHCELDFDGPYQLLVATILSAQCTDARVNLVTPSVFAKYPDAADLQVMRVVAEIDEILARKSENGESFEEWFWTNEGFLRHPVWGEIRELSRAFLVR